MRVSPKPLPKKSNKTYEMRSDLQGVRGWAVAAVVTYHFFPSALPYGYLGVDVFFVLSGFLISLVLDRLDPCCLTTYTSFYFRRFRRIFPMLSLVATAIVLIVLVYVKFLHDDSLLYYSTRSALYSLAFASNLKARDRGEEYFMKLEKADDPLTHTWSLAVEIQFYCIAPLLFYLVKKQIGERRRCPVTGILFFSFLSFCYNILSDTSVAFNSVLARLWQFLIGSAIFHIQNSSYSHKNMEECHEEKGYHADLIHYAAFIAFLLPTLLVPQAKDLYLRIITTLFTALLIYLKPSSAILTGRPIVLLGDASFSLYLIHWPAVCLLKEWKMESFYDKCVAIIVCLILSFLSQHFYEKWYQSLNERGTFTLTGLLYTAAIVIIANTEGTPISMFFNAYGLRDTNTELPFGVELERAWDEEWQRNLSSKEIIELNNLYSLNWEENLQLNCTMADKNDKNPWGMCVAPKGDGAHRFLSVGNSYNANIGRLIQKHFRMHYSDLDFYTVPGCQAICVASEDDVCGDSSMFFNITTKRKYDVIFVIQRWHFPNQPIDNIKTDERLKEITRIVDNYGEMAKKVFVLSALPKKKRTRQQKKTNNSSDRSLNIPFEEANATSDRIRLDELAKRCTNCVLFDVYQRHIDKNGDFIRVHPHTHIHFFERGEHYTPYGLRLIEPVIESMANEFSRLMTSTYPNNIFRLDDSGVIEPSH